MYRTHLVALVGFFAKWWAVTNQMRKMKAVGRRNMVKETHPMYTF